MNGRITPKQVAIETGKTVNRIQQLCLRKHIPDPIAKKIGSNWWLLPRAVEFVKALPDRRGRPSKKNIKNNVQVT